MTRTAHSTRLRMLLGTLARSFLLVGLTGCPWVSPDVHGDRVADASGNCPNDPNPDQSGVDEDGIGDVCDPSPETRVIPDCPNDPDNDADGDGICGDVDNCPAVLNADQTDSDSDGVGDACDGCPNDRNKIEPGHCGCSEPDTDTDGDGKPDCRDNCPDVPNPGQEDEDGDCVGDACDECSDTPAGMKVDSRGWACDGVVNWYITQLASLTSREARPFEKGGVGVLNSLAIEMWIKKAHNRQPGWRKVELADDIKREARKALSMNTWQLKNRDIVLIPLNRHDHWSLLVYYKRRPCSVGYTGKEQFYLYDTLNMSSHRRLAKKVVMLLFQCGGIFTKTGIIYHDATPSQSGGWECAYEGKPPWLHVDGVRSRR